MTKTENAALQELGLTPEQLAERQAKVNALLHGDAEPRVLVVTHKDGFEEVVGHAQPARKTRSDAGKPKPRKQPAAPAQGGTLTKEQASRLLDLIATRDSRRAEWDMYEAQKEKAGENAEAAHQRFDDADAEAIAYIRENTVK